MFIYECLVVIPLAIGQGKHCNEMRVIFSALEKRAKFSNFIGPTDHGLTYSLEQARAQLWDE